ncbi:response regulator transcription factor [Paenibacillus andongensis]|uniref:response regulator transcription factor n=1 Tax=Paenibacillus andongensis TaxID=2975482 RepID=UPI0021BBA862|nr:response regulator [Paenibacillus andongensis]
MIISKVIIVEDQPHFRKGLVTMIELNQPEWIVVGEASNGEDALPMLDRFKPDVVLTDINMPIMNGIDFISLLRNKYPDLIVIILTGYRNFEHAQAAVKLGVFDFLTKPCSEQDVRHVLHKAFLKLNERHSKQEQQSELSLEEKRISDLEAQFISAILTGEASILQQVLDQFIAYLKPLPYYKLKLEALSLAVALQRTAQNYLDIEESGLYNKTSMDMTDLTSDKIFVWTKVLSDSFMSCFQRWQLSKSKNTIDKAVKYIEEHYEQDCSLTDVASYVQMNPSYLSVLFKKATGERFKNYLNRMRMDKAALLLRNSDMKISEIASATGFDEPNYFTNVFRQQYQMSPKEFRNSISM